MSGVEDDDLENSVSMSISKKNRDSVIHVAQPGLNDMVLNFAHNINKNTTIQKEREDLDMNVSVARNTFDWPQVEERNSVKSIRGFVSNDNAAQDAKD